MHWQCLAFPGLSTKRLYEILKIRQEVFAVEQDCVYLDVDGKDMDALHVFATRDDELIAYCRILPPGLKYPEASIGRVLTTSAARGSGIRISAQLYLEEFYHSFGFASCSLPYPEDGIPHIEMLKP